MKLLIVDDSKIMRNAIGTYLKNYPFEQIEFAGNGLEAIEKFREINPDFVTLDITMPEMDGIECLENILEINPRTIVIIVTALADKGTGLTGLKKGARAFINKPITKEKLKSVFDNLLKRNA